MNKLDRDKKLGKNNIKQFQLTDHLKFIIWQNLELGEPTI